MSEYARLTGLASSGSPPRRYLWTDAFAVCNYLELHRQTGEDKWLDLARNLVGQVHEVLGRYREDDSRTGWISGLDEVQGTLHPTAGGLRIGKALPERRPGEAYDERLEWDRDGQYYHYLTKWMQALDQLSRVTGERTYNRWALELAQTAHSRFVVLSPSGTGHRMYWKMSIDLSRPLVPAMGQHDPLDGLITYAQLRDTADADPDRPEGLALEMGSGQLAAMCRVQDWSTNDPLSLGGLLSDAYRSIQLIGRGADLPTDLPARLLDSCLPGLAAFEGLYPLNRPAAYRLAFRELGLAIGLQAADRIGSWLDAQEDRLGNAPAVHSRLRKITPYAGLRDSLETFWLDRRHQAVPSWTDHREINLVMLATSLAPDGYFTLPVCSERTLPEALS
jgi:hypothetical protein